MNKEKLTQSQWYKSLRPENFSDSEISHNTILPKETLAFELEKISTNQKQDQFETLGRKLAEKFISPNLIPQVGPTGGGDGKTDTETYPVSSFISDRWFVPQNGWKNNEKWAFAISSKKQWKGKVKKDIINILETDRDYTKIYFISNQKISSKKKKDAQDEFAKEFKIEVIILDGEWILEKIYSNNLIDLTVDALNLSTDYKSKNIKLGKNDAERIKILEKLEEDIKNPNRYFDADFQLVEDALEAARLSRMLEKPRDEVEGKFERAIRFCEKVNNSGQWIRIHYHRAWTYSNYYDDYVAFVNEYKSFSKYINKNTSISEIELYINLFNLLKGLHFRKSLNLDDFQLEIGKERSKVFKFLNAYGKNEKKPISALIAKTHKAILELMDSVVEQKKADDIRKILNRLIGFFKESGGKLDYPFESFKRQVEVVGEIMPNSKDYDKLIDVIADVSQKRTSELNSGEIFLKRGGQKLFANYYKESIIYFGRAVLKLAKEETQKGLYLALIGLGDAYSSLGLIWASNNCLISACSISFKTWFENGILNKQALNCVEQLALNELLIGRIPTFLTWNELFIIISRQLNIIDSENNIKTTMLLDGCFSNRILNTDIEKEKGIYSVLPDVLTSQDLEFSTNSLFYKLGQLDLIFKEFEIKFKNQNELDSFFEKAVNQPFRKQMMYPTNCMSKDKLSIYSIILGCKFIIKLRNEVESLIIAETLLAFFESFLATSLTGIFPKVEEILIHIEKPITDKLIDFKTKESNSEYLCFIDKFDFSPKNHKEIWESMVEFIINIITNNFFVEEPLKHIENLFKDEEINDRISFVFNHRAFTINVLGDKPKLFANDWINEKLKNYPNIRKKPVEFNFDEENDKKLKKEERPNLETVRHDKRKIYSVIDDSLWNGAHWHGFGFIPMDNFVFAIFIGFKNGVNGKNIFDKWITKYGKEDKKDLIKISIIKGVDVNNPCWYKIVIGSNIEIDKEEDIEVYMASQRIHKMEPNSTYNIDNLINLFNQNKKYLLIPAQVSHDGSNVEPYFDKSILKRKLYIKNAWELCETDFEQVAITKDDNPIIPDDVKDAPILRVLKNRK